MITLGKCSSHPSFKNPLLQKLETIAESQTSLKQEEQLTMVFPATVDISTMQPLPLIPKKRNIAEERLGRLSQPEDQED